MTTLSMRRGSPGGTSSSASPTSSSNRSRVIATGNVSPSGDPGPGRVAGARIGDWSDQLGVDDDFVDSGQRPRDRAGVLGGVGELDELGLVDAGNVAPGDEFDLG